MFSVAIYIVPSDLSLTALRALSRYARMMLTEEFLQARALERAFKLHESAEKEVVVAAVRKKKREEEDRAIATGERTMSEGTSIDVGGSGGVVNNGRSVDTGGDASISIGSGLMAVAVASKLGARRKSISDGFVDKEYAQLSSSEWDEAKANGATAEADHWLFTVLDPLLSYFVHTILGVSYNTLSLTVSL